MTKEKHIVGVDFGTGYTYIVACREILENGVKKLVDFKRLTPFGNKVTGTRSLLEKNGDSYTIPTEKDKSKKQVKVKDELFDFVRGVSAKIGEEDDFAEYIDAEYEELREIMSEDSHLETTKYFELIFSEMLKVEAKYLNDVESVEFIIGTPPGYGKAYAEELKKCVKNGFLLARKKYNGESDSVKLKSACYPEPVLAGYAWLDKNKTEKGLKNNEDCLVVDIGAGTVDFAFLTRVNNVINAKKFDDGKDGHEKRLCCSGTNENEPIAGDDQDEAICKDYSDLFGIDLDENTACKIKEGLHRPRRENEKEEDYLSWKDGKNRFFDINGVCSYIGKNPSKNSVALSHNGNNIIDFERVQTGVDADDGTELNNIYQRVAEVIERYLSQYVISKNKKILFIGGSSNVDKLKEIVCDRLAFNYKFKRCDTTALVSAQSKELGIPLNHANAVAVGACLAHDRDELIVTPSLRIYMRRADDDTSFEMHTLINDKGLCTGPILFTSEELKHFGKTIEFFFREGGELKIANGGEKVAPLDVELTYKKLRSGVEQTKIGNTEVVDDGERFPLNKFSEIKIEQNKGVSLIVFASKHGLDMGKSFVYFIKKVGKVSPSDKIDLEVLDSQFTKATGEEKLFSLEIENPSSEDERAFNSASFSVSETAEGYNIACYKVGIEGKKILDDKLLGDADPKIDDYQYIKIFNKNWKED